MCWSVFLFLASAVIATAETPIGSASEREGERGESRPVPAEVAKPRIDRLTWALLAADGGARALDAYSTRRMLKNNCGSGLQMAGTSTCNYEQNLPGFITDHPAGIHAFDGAIWLTEFTATRFLIRHHHRRIARLIPVIDFLSTTSFAVNNLTLSIGVGGAAAPVASKSRHKWHP